MDLRQLRVLQAVGESGSFSAAAERLDYTQPAVSKIVATLERQLGTTLVGRGGHRLERNPTIRFADLGGESWLLGDFGADSPSFRMIDRRCREAGFDPHVAYRINDCQMAQALVAAGEGIALLPRLMLRPAHQGVAIRPLATDPPSRRVSAVRLSTRYLTPATERFTELLVAASADHADHAD